MLNKASKLKDPALIKTVLKDGRRSRVKHLSVFFLASSQSTFQAAVVISKKVAGTAIKRNRVRRVLFAGLASAELDLGKRAPGAMVVLVSALPEEDPILIVELNQCLNKLSLA